MNGRRPTPIFATNFVSEERDLALRGFVSPLGSRARQTSMSGSLGTLALYATPPIQSIRQSWASSGKASMALFPLADHNRLTALSQTGRFSILDF
jgi:hypothetical protein